MNAAGIRRMAPEKAAERLRLMDAWMSAARSAGISTAPWDGERGELAGWVAETLGKPAGKPLTSGEKRAIIGAKEKGKGGRG